MPGKPKQPEGKFEIGQRIRANLHTGAGLVYVGKHFAGLFKA